MLLIPVTTTLLGKAHNNKKVTKVYMNCRALKRYKELL